MKGLASCLNRYYGQKVIILLDEYDTPMQEAYVHGYWDEFTSFIRSFFNSTFKTNPYMERAIMTGITLTIEEKQYDVELLEQGIKKSQIRHYGFAFEGKKVLIDGN